MIRAPDGDHATHSPPEPPGGPMKAIPICTALLVTASAAFADTVYRSTMPDGSVVYGQSPQAGAKVLRQVSPTPASSGVITVTAEELERGRSLGGVPQPSAPAVSIVPLPARERPPELQQGRERTRYMLPERAY
jgi:hypothetical protein